MLDFDAICRGRTRFSRSLLFFDAWSWCYLSWPDIFWRSLLAFRSWLWPLFVVFQSTWPFYCLPSMLDFDAICRGRTYFWRSLLFFDVRLWRYMWCSRALGHFIVCLRCLILTLFVVAGSTFGSHWLLDACNVFGLACRAPRETIRSAICLYLCTKASYGSEPSFGKLGPIPPIAFERPKSGRGHQKLCNSWNLINTTHLESFVAAAIVNTVLDDDEWEPNEPKLAIVVWDRLGFVFVSVKEVHH